MVLKTDKESKLLELSKTFDGAINERDENKLKSLLASDVIVHHDGLTTTEDIRGQDAACEYFQSYWRKYDYTNHKAVCGAVDEQPPPVSFSFWVDQGVKPKGSSEEPVTTTGIWYHVLDGEKVKEIWYLRQLSKDELKRKISVPQKLTFDPHQFQGCDPSIEPSEERAKKMDKAARVFDSFWKTGDASKADEIMTEDVTMVDPVFGKTTKGVKDFKEMISKYADMWSTKSQESRIAVSAGDKAFIWWFSTGTTKKGESKQETMYGLNLIKFNKDCKMTDIVGFRQPTSGELDSMTSS